MKRERPIDGKIRLRKRFCFAPHVFSNDMEHEYWLETVELVEEYVDSYYNNTDYGYWNIIGLSDDFLEKEKNRK